MLRVWCYVLGWPLLTGTARSSARIVRSPPLSLLCPCRWSSLGDDVPAVLLPGSMSEAVVQAGGRELSQAAFISEVLRELIIALAAAMRPCVSQARSPPRGPPVGPRCVGLPGPLLKW
jgi:hypothetical protein